MRTPILLLFLFMIGIILLMLISSCQSQNKFHAMKQTNDELDALLENLVQQKAELTNEERKKLLEMLNEFGEIKKLTENQEFKVEEVNEPNEDEFMDDVEKQDRIYNICGLDDAEFQQFKLDLEDHVPDFLFLSSSVRPPLNFFSRFLSLNENIRSPQPLESSFFSFPFIKRLNVNSYQSLFLNTHDDHERKVVMGDFSESYLSHPLAPRRIATLLPNIKIIIFLQNPVERAYFSYLDRVNSKIESQTFERIISGEFNEIEGVREAFRACYNNQECSRKPCIPLTPVYYHDADATPHFIKNEHELRDYLSTSYIFKSMYDDMIERWLSLFPRENILILSQSDFFGDKFESLNQIADFLSIPRHSFTILEKQHENDVELVEKVEDEERHIMNLPINRKTYTALCRFFRPFNDRLFQLIGKKLNWCPTKQPSDYQNFVQYDDLDLKNLQ